MNFTYLEEHSYCILHITCVFHYCILHITCAFHITYYTYMSSLAVGNAGLEATIAELKAKIQNLEDDAADEKLRYVYVYMYTYITYISIHICIYVLRCESRAHVCVLLNFKNLLEYKMIIHNVTYIYICTYKH
jgi:hypothetical protein